MSRLPWLTVLFSGLARAGYGSVVLSNSLRRSGSGSGASGYPALVMQPPS